MWRADGTVILPQGFIHIYLSKHCPCGSLLSRAISHRLASPSGTVLGTVFSPYGTVYPRNRFPFYIVTYIENGSRLLVHIVYSLERGEHRPSNR